VNCKRVDDMGGKEPLSSSENAGVLMVESQRWSGMKKDLERSATHSRETAGGGGGGTGLLGGDSGVTFTVTNRQLKIRGRAM